MPIRADLKVHYGKAWQVTRAAILARAGNKCECTGQCGDDHVFLVFPSVGCRCGVPNGVTIWREVDNQRVWWCAEGGAKKPETRPVRVVLTVAHLNHTAGDDRPENLLALCQRCHLRLDREQHAASRRAKHHG